jgi:PIN domain nuclease of toxin-antitoxin system
VEKLKTLIQCLKLPENISKKHWELQEDLLLVWIYKNLNNSKENLILVSQIKLVEIKLLIKLNGQLDLEAKLASNNLKMMTFTVET